MNNPVNRDSYNYVFTTEGHLIPLGAWQHDTSWDKDHFKLNNVNSSLNLSKANVSITIGDDFII